MSLSGSTASLGLDEVVTLLALGGLEGVLTVARPDGGRLSLTFRRGRLVVPDGEAEDHLEQVRDLLTRRRARYWFQPRRLPEEGVTEVEPQALLVDAARLQDDETRGFSRSEVRRRLESDCQPSLEATPPLLQGDLDGLGLPILLQALRDRRHTGTLRVTGREGEERLYFKGGEAYALRDDGLDDFARELLGDLGSASVSSLAASCLDEEDLPAEEATEIRDRFLEVLFWEGARFTFHARDLPEEFHAPPEGITRIALRTHLFLLRAVQRLDAWTPLRRALRGSESVFRFRSPQKKLEAIRADGGSELLTLIDGRRSFDDLVRLSGADRIAAARRIVTLFRRGDLVRRVDRMAERRRHLAG